MNRVLHRGRSSLAALLLISLAVSAPVRAQLSPEPVPEGGNADDRYVDIAYDATTGNWLSVWERSYAIDHVEIYGLLSSETGSVLVRLAVGAGVSSRPACAFVRHSGRFLVVWLRANHGLGPYGIEAVCVNPDGTVSNTVSLVPPSEQVAEVVLAGDPTGTANHALMAWKKIGWGVVATSVNCWATPGSSPTAGAAPLSHSTASSKTVSSQWRSTLPATVGR